MINKYYISDFNGGTQQTINSWLDDSRLFGYGDEIILGENTDYFLKIIAIKGGYYRNESSLTPLGEFTDFKDFCCVAKSMKIVTGTYTLLLSDAKGALGMNSSTNANFIIPSFADVPFPIGTRIDFSQEGVGATIFVAGADVVLNSSGGKLMLADRYSGATDNKNSN